MKPFLILQLRPEDQASDDEYAAFLKFGHLKPENTRRIRMEKDGLPPINLDDYSGIIVGGGPYCVSDSAKPPEQQRFEAQLHDLLDDVVQRDFPFLGTCYGLGILADYLGGHVSKERYGEDVGAVTVMLNQATEMDPLLVDLPAEFRAFGGHKEACQELPPGATHLARSATCPVQMIRVNKNVYGVQFHTELDSHGLELRINVYKNAGYFPPEEAESLIAKGHQEVVNTPVKILERFVQRYKVE